MLNLNMTGNGKSTYVYIVAGYIVCCFFQTRNPMETWWEPVNSTRKEPWTQDSWMISVPTEGSRAAKFTASEKELPSPRLLVQDPWQVDLSSEFKRCHSAYHKTFNYPQQYSEAHFLYDELHEIYWRIDIYLLGNWIWKCNSGRCWTRTAYPYTLSYPLTLGRRLLAHLSFLGPLNLKWISVHRKTQPSNLEIQNKLS